MFTLTQTMKQKVIESEGRNDIILFYLGQQTLGIVQVCPGRMEKGWIEIQSIGET